MQLTKAGVQCTFEEGGMLEKASLRRSFELGIEGCIGVFRKDPQGGMFQAAGTVGLMALRYGQE